MLTPVLLQTRPEHSVNPLAQAFAIALLVHIGLIIIWPNLHKQAAPLSREISVILNRPAPAEPEQSAPPLPSSTTPPSAVKKTVPPPEVMLVEPETKPEPGQRRISLSPQHLRRWSEQETRQFLRQRPQELQNFAGTFIEPVPESAEVLETYVSVYGEQHVVATLNGKKVCYLQGPTKQGDDWSADVVMFYACGETEKFDLKMP